MILHSVTCCSGTTTTYTITVLAKMFRIPLVFILLCVDKGAYGQGGGLCSDEETVQSQEMLQSCSHSMAISFHTSIQDIASGEIISDKLCDAFNKVRTDCVRHIQECFADEDAEEIKKNHLESMKAFLLSIVNEKAPNNALDNCKNTLGMHGDENIIENVTEYYLDDVEVTDEITVRIDTSESITKVDIVELMTDEIQVSDLSTTNGMDSKANFVEATEKTVTQSTVTRQRTTKAIVVQKPASTDLIEASTETTTEVQTFTVDSKTERLHSTNKNDATSDDFNEKVDMTMTGFNNAVTQAEDKNSMDEEVENPYYASARVTLDFPLPNNSSHRHYCDYALLVILLTTFLLQ